VPFVVEGVFALVALKLRRDDEAAETATGGDSSGVSGAVGARNSRRFAIGFFGALFLLLAGLYATGYALTSDRVPRDVSVDGVDIGGLSPAAAEQRLRERLVPRAEAPIVARHGDDTYRVDPAGAGLTLDVQQTVASAGGGRSLNPLRMIEMLAGGEDVEPVVEVDDAALDQAVGRLARKVSRRPVEGAVRFVGGRVKPVYPSPGERLDRQATAQALQDTFLDEQPVLELSVRQTPTRLSDRDVDAAVARFGEPAMSGAVHVRADGRTVRVTPTQVGAALSMRPSDGRLVPRIDAEKLRTSAGPAIDRLTRAPRPARVVLRDGSPEVVPGEAGTVVNTKRLATSILGVLDETGEEARTVTAQTRTEQPAFGTGDARKLGIDHVVSSFTTHFPHSSYRNNNLGRAAELISGTVLRPGEIFSLNDTVGERTAANGFVKGFIIDDGVLVQDFGGGVSQVATTTYNAAFFAGLKDIEHHPHSIWFDRYPMGREATVAWGALDLRFQNNTPYGVLIQAWIEPSTPTTYGAMHVRMWSSDYWDVRARLSDQYDFTKSGVIYDTKGPCYPETGYAGFEVNSYRDIYLNGEKVRTEKRHVTYDPLDTVKCHPPPKKSDDGGGQASGGDGTGGDTGGSGTGGGG
jgi:vancomycin resistance protein YoaR